MDRFTFVVPKKRGRVDDFGGDPQIPNSSNVNANVVEDIVMPNMEDNEDEEDDEEEEGGVTLVAAEGSSLAEDSESDNESGGWREELASTAIAAVTGKKPGGSVDLSQDPAEGPRRPQLKSYPTRKFGSQSRGFNNSWFKQYSWLEYSLSVDAAFCYACRHFIHHGPGHIEKSFTHAGF